MNIGVEVLKESVIRVQSQLNDWMDCVFVVSKDDEEKAREVLEKAWDSFWEDGDGWCYGNYLEDKLVNAGIAFDAYYADAEEWGHGRIQGHIKRLENASRQGRRNGVELGSLH